MPYDTYVDVDYYTNDFKSNIIPKEKIKGELKSASRNIDTLTFNRIVEVGFENLTEFQQNIIKEVICSLADFKFENKDVLDSVFSSYSINGVSANLDNGGNIKVIKGVAIPKNLYGYLEQTGLTCRSFRWHHGLI